MLDLIEMGRKAAEEGVSVPEQIEAEIAEAEADKRTYAAPDRRPPEADREPHT